MQRLISIIISSFYIFVHFLYTMYFKFDCQGHQHHQLNKYRYDGTQMVIYLSYV